MAVERDNRGGPASTSGGGPTLGTTRNRTEAFLKYRNRARASSRPFATPGTTTTTAATSASDASLETARLVANALGGNSPDSAADATDAETGLVAPPGGALAPRYVAFKEQLTRDMSEIRERMSELRSLHGKASLSKFEDTKDDEIAVEVATQQITRLFRRCEERLRNLAPTGNNVAPPSTADERVQRNVQRTLALDLQRLSGHFRKQQKQYLQRLRARDGGATASTSSFDGLASRTGNDGVEGSSLLGFDPGFSDVQMQQADTLTALVDERDREVMKIVSSIGELAQIMKDLSTLVIDQGTVLDRIDYNLEETSAVVDQGVRQLRRAERAQKRGAMASCVLVLLVAVVAMLIIVMLKAAFI